MDIHISAGKTGNCVFVCLCVEGGGGGLQAT